MRGWRRGCGSGTAPDAGRRRLAGRWRAGRRWAPVVAGAALLVGHDLATPAPLAGQAGAGPQAEQLVVRYQYRGREAFGRIEGDIIREIPGADAFTAAVSPPTGRTFPLEDVRVLPPMQAELVEKVLGVERNTVRPGRARPVPNPRWYARFPSTMNRHEGDVELPDDASNFTYAGGLVVIIGREGRHIPEGAAADHIWGVTIGNDLHDATWYGERRGEMDPGRVAARATDGWFPVGPWAAVGLEWRNLRIETRLNGEVVQAGRTTDLVNGIPDLVSDISRYVTLRPGDLIFVGSVPYREGARRRLRVGDVVEVEVEGIGVLRNTVVPMQEPGAGP